MTDEENVQQPVSEPAGSQLRRGREQKGLSVADVANAQHLRPAIIQSIENGDYQQIGSELFLKGYVRAYAKQVGLDADAIVSSLDQELEPLRQQQVQAMEASPLVDIERRKRQKRRVARALILLLAAALVAFFAFRFVDDGGGQSVDEAENETAVEETGGQESEPESASAIPADASEQAEQAEQPEFAAPDESDQTITEPAPEDVAPTADTESAAPESDVAESAAEVGAVGADEEADDELDESRIPVVTSSTEPALMEDSRTGNGPLTGRLEVAFDDDCWIEVTDSSGARLVSSLQREGDRIDVSGPAPLSVVIGAVDAVSDIRFQGEPVELSDYRVVNNRTQFSLEI
ncbi:helix-turn-helix domain-containing protein [Marinobacter lipolyticus]|uniref:RodZ domain-containing protein n=1 Tax=Marinobacter lipolyticus TaxID=209639 RepID=UPI001BCFB8DA|nr:RodZ domain-containing protein [Marinobacter lipolyticus]MBS8239295.1 helix-turn-helix domain-containing protein [Marinobacter lipolyticus]